MQQSKAHQQEAAGFTDDPDPGHFLHPAWTQGGRYTPVRGGGWGQNPAFQTRFPLLPCPSHMSHAKQKYLCVPGGQLETCVSTGSLGSGGPELLVNTCSLKPSSPRI